MVVTSPEALKCFSQKSAMLWMDTFPFFGKLESIITDVLIYVFNLGFLADSINIMI